MKINEIVKIQSMVCDKCERIITKNNYNKHYNTCDGDPTPKKKRNKIGVGCGWSKGRTFIEIYGEDKSKEIKIKMIANKIKFNHTNESKNQISNSMKGNINWINSTTKSGRGKKGYYNGIFFMSTWELAFMVYYTENGLKFDRNWERFEYSDVAGNKRYYIPDFIVNDTYIEVKGYLTEKVDFKIKSFNHPLIVLGKVEIKPMIDYVKNKYGTNFYEILKDK